MGSVDCIEWTRARSAAGYGQLWDGQRVIYAHRKAWEDARGPIPDGMFVCHHCDNRACVNVDHLFLGSVADNNRDMREKGRAVAPPRHPGTANPSARLTEDQVRAIRADHRLLRQIAQQYGIAIATVSQIRRGKTWRTVA